MSSEVKHLRRIDLFGVGCLLIASGLFTLSVPLQCAAQAARIGGFSLADGFVFGIALALITRTRCPLFIYLALALAVLTFIPLFRAWPPGGPWDVTLQPGMPEIFVNYLDLLRVALFMLGFPYPFARFGQHAPDSPSETEPPL